MAIAEAPRPERWRLIAWLVLALAFAAIGYAAQAADDEPPEDFAYDYAFAIGAAIQFGITLGLVLLIARRLDRREVFALRRPKSWPKALGFAFLGLLVVYLASYLYVLASGADPSEEQGLVPTEWDSSRVAPFVLFFVSVALGAPLVEELTYRGLGFYLLSPYGAWTSILVTGVLFGLAHGLLEALPILATFGIVLGWIRARTSSIYPCIALHGLFNSIAVIVSVSA